MEEEEQFPMPGLGAQGSKSIASSVVDMEWRTYVETTTGKLKFSELCWDRHAAHGQLRVLDLNAVQYFLAKLLSGDQPVVPYEIYGVRLPGIPVSNAQLCLGIFSLPSTDGRVVILGGQHFTAALKKAREQLLNPPKSVPEEQLPECYKYVRAIILRSDAPLNACRAAAGAHQAGQSDSLEATPADCLRYLCSWCEEKKKDCGVPNLSEEELWACLCSMGMQRGNQEILEKNIRDIDVDRSVQYSQQQVCPECLGKACIFCPLCLHKKTRPSRCGVPWGHLQPASLVPARGPSSTMSS